MNGMLRRLTLVLLLVPSALLLTGCDREDNRLDLSTLLPEPWKPYATYKLDTNGDGVQEWVLLYTYDEKEQKAFTPIGGVIYHADRGRPPVVFPYPLIAPGWSYLGEGTSSISLSDMIETLRGSEVVFQSVNSDGVTTRVVLFHWEDHAQDDLLPPVADEQMGQWYHCVGQFHGDAGVKVETNKATVWERTQERSQLAIRKTYRPLQGTYMSGKQLIAPTETCLDFAYGLPKDVDKSPYPEKVLMAFLSHFTTEEAFGFLTESAQQKLRTGANVWGDIAPWPRLSVTGVCVKELNYNPDAEIQAQATMVAQAQENHIAQATADAQATRCVCPTPDCTCLPSPTAPQTGPLVWVTARIEFHLLGQSEQVALAWGLVKVNDVWRIDDVVRLS